MPAGVNTRKNHGFLYATVNQSSDGCPMVSLHVFSHRANAVHTLPEIALTLSRGELDCQDYQLGGPEFRSAVRLKRTGHHHLVLFFVLNASLTFDPPSSLCGILIQLSSKEMFLGWNLSAARPNQRSLRTD